MITAITAKIPPVALSPKQANDSSCGLTQACINVGMNAILSTATDTPSAINGFLNTTSDAIPTAAPIKQTMSRRLIPSLLRRRQPNIVIVAQAMNVIKVITALAIAPSAKADTVITPAKTAHTAHDTRRGRTVPRITANMYGTDAAAETSVPIVTKTDIIKILSATNNALRYMPRLVIIFICNTTALKKLADDIAIAGQLVLN